MAKSNNTELNSLKKKLGEVCTYSKGKKPPILSIEKSKECSIPYINIKAFEKGIFDEYTNGEKCNLCNDDDLLMVWDGARCGLIGKAKKGAVSSTLMKILPKENIHKEYLYHFISSKYWTLNTKPKGVGIPHIEPTLLWNIELVVSPLPEQQAIVSKIEELLSDLENGKQQLQTAQQQLKVYRQSLLKWAFDGKLTNKNVKEGELPKGWKWVKLGEVSKVSGGLTKNAKRQELDLKVPFLRVANVYYNFLDLNEIHLIGIKENEIERVKLLKDDLLFVEGNGSIDQIGRVALWNGIIDNCVHQNHLIKARLSNQINPKYALHYFCSKTGRTVIKKVANSTSGLHTLNLSKISKLELPLPPIEQQQHIVDELESKLTVCDNIEETISQSLQQAETLRQSILKKAFEGRLVEQNPNDEPASKVLERMKENKGKDMPKARYAKRKSRRDDIIIEKNVK